MRRPPATPEIPSRVRLTQPVALSLACFIVLGCIANPGTARTGSPSVPPASASPGRTETADVSTPATAPHCDPTGDVPPTLFTTGTATFDGDDGRIHGALGLTTEGTFVPSYQPACPSGAQAEWASSSEDEWHLTVLSNTGPNDAFDGQWATLWIERYGTEPPLHAEGSSCAITITEVAPSGLVGHAECPGMRWLNEYEAEMAVDASPLPDYAPFDLSISFGARP